MSEWSPGSSPQEDDKGPSGSERRPVPFPLPRLEQMAPAPRPIERPPERPPVVLFDRSLIETQVSAPAIGVTHEQVVAEAVRETEEADDDDTEPLPIRPTETVPPRPTSSASRQASAPAPVATMPSPRFEDVMETAGMGQAYTEAVSGDRLGEYMVAEPTQFGGETTPLATTEYIDQQDELEDPYAAVQASASPQPSRAQQHTASFGGASNPNYVAPPAPTPNTQPSTPFNPSTHAPGQGGGGFPPVPPGPNFNAYGAPSGGSGGSPNTASDYNYAPSQGYNPNVSPEDAYTHDDVQNAGRAGVRKGLVAGGVAGWFAGRHFAKKGFRKREKQMQQDFAEQMRARDDAAMQNEQTRLRGREVRDAITGRVAGAATVPERPVSVPSAPPAYERPVAVPQTPAAYERFSAESQPFGVVPGPRHPEATAPAPVVEQAPLQPSAERQPPAPFEHQAEQPYHKVRSEWLEIAVDQHGNAIQQEYGRAYHEETQAEQTGSRQYMTDPSRSGGASLSAADGGRSLAGIGSSMGSFADGNSASGAGGTTGHGAPAQPLHDPSSLPAGSAPLSYAHTLPDGRQYTADVQHRLTKPKKQVVSNIANPWFWLMLGIIGAAFFAAALI